MALLYLSGCGALSVRLSFINVVEIAQRLHLPRVAFDNTPTRQDEDALLRVSTLPSPKKVTEINICPYILCSKYM